MSCSHATCGECVKAGCGWNGKCVPVGEAGASTKCAVYANTFVTPKPTADSLDGVGSVGYVGMDNRTMKTVNPKDVDWSGDFTLFPTTARSMEMKNCTPAVRYGDMVTLTAEQGEASVGEYGVVRFKGKPTKFLVRPPSGVDMRQGSSVKYGEEVVLTTTTALKDEKCGVYGCGVGQIIDGHYVMREGGVNGGMALKITWKDKAGEVRYGDPFTLSVEKLKAKVVKRKVMFGEEADTFGFGPSKSCDVNALQGMCGTDCAGILLSPSTNEWQMLLPGATYESRTSTQQVAYVKTPKLMLEDPSCQGGVLPIETSIFSGFQATGQLRPKGENQCAPEDTSRINDLIKAAMPREGMTTQEIDRRKLQNRQKQAQDWSIIETQNMARTALWAVLLVGIAAAVWKARE